jgi:hypothetical protein
MQHIPNLCHSANLFILFMFYMSLKNDFTAASAAAKMLTIAKITAMPFRGS